jgi:hypothetical protein
MDWKDAVSYERRGSVVIAAILKVQSRYMLGRLMKASTKYVIRTETALKMEAAHDVTLRWTVATVKKAWSKPHSDACGV